jgi:hypothetical protein
MAIRTLPLPGGSRMSNFMELPDVVKLLSNSISVDLTPVVET